MGRKAQLPYQHVHKVSERRRPAHEQTNRERNDVKRSRRKNECEHDTREGEQRERDYGDTRVGEVQYVAQTFDEGRKTT